MNTTDIEIHTGGVDRPYKSLGEIKAKCSAGSLFSGEPTITDVNSKLQEAAMQRGANAVLYVSYDRGMSLTSYKNLWATGEAVILEASDKACPLCAEMIKRAAIRCRYCGGDVSAAAR
ncbi:hypothetical protein SAMN05421819_3569 [Bryocella elongata]|uniref:Heavy-metal-binding n=1 Tax=Bryocella elongata TaxID=863522 RepID=A0A1H6B7A8_9BACT|nr:hypothetical protein [Bryocella elongata]SEG56414.1 hypothetical protein SAMN05421819_3569 [Bryocella elongata]